MAQAKKKKRTPEQAARRNAKRTRRRAARAQAAKTRMADDRLTLPMWSYAALNALAFFLVWLIVFWFRSGTQHGFGKLLLALVAFSAAEWAYMAYVLPRIVRSVMFYPGEDREEHRKRTLKEFWSNALVFVAFALCMAFIADFACPEPLVPWAVLMLYGMGGALYGILFWSVNELVAINRHIVTRQEKKAEEQE